MRQPGGQSGRLRRGYGTGCRGGARLPATDSSYAVTEPGNVRSYPQAMRAAIALVAGAQARVEEHKHQSLQLAAER